MLKVKEFLYSYLKNDATLQTLLTPQGKLCYAWPSSFSILPVISYQEVNQAASEYFDNMPASYDCSIQIDIFTAKGTSTYDISNRIDELLKAKKWHLQYSADIFNESNLGHKVLRYTNTITSGDLSV